MKTVKPTSFELGEPETILAISNNLTQGGDVVEVTVAE